MAKKPLFVIDPDSEVKASGNGYIYVTTTPDHPYGETRPEHNKKYVYKHRALMELKLNRYLTKDEDVHHKDEDNSNNALSNLEVATSSDHPRDHALKRKFWKKSPRTKKRKTASVYNVVSQFLSEQI